MGKRSKKRRSQQKKKNKQQAQPQKIVEIQPVVEAPVVESKKPGFNLSDQQLKIVNKIITYGVVIFVVVLGLMKISKEISSPLPGTTIEDLGNEHIGSPETDHQPYNSKPPTSGSHVGGIAPWGVHDTQIADEIQIHNLEDGGVLVQYDCPDNSCPELIEQLTELVEKHHSEVILAPYAGLEKKIALTAWTKIDFLDKFDEDRINDFINSYKGIDHHK